MSYIEINSKYISRTRKEHECEWCGTKIEIGSEAWYRFYEFEGDKHSAYMHAECAEACDLAHQDPETDLQDGWQMGDYHRGEWLHREDCRYPHRSTWEIIRQYEAFDRLQVGDLVRSSIDPTQTVWTIETVGDKGHLIKIADVHPLALADRPTDLLDRDTWVLHDWREIEERSN